jgi:hypothetical protein
MKKKLFTILAACALSAVSFGQIELIEDGVVVESPSVEVTGDTGPDVHFKGYYIFNSSDETIVLDWSRHNLSGGNCLDDQVCTDESCYVPFTDDLIFNAPETREIPSGDTIYFKVGGQSDVNCCAIFRYYLKTGLGTIQDSIEVKYKIGDVDCFLSAEEETKAEISVFPNPANNTFNIVMSNVSQETYSVELFNLVGERVLVENLVNGQNTIDVSTLPAGVYFYTIFDGQSTVETKKLIVRH